MLQQTQIARVIPKWIAFLERFPTVADCAAAELGDVLRLWQGLGYPRRARNLYEAAGEIDRLGTFPDTLEQLLALPGVGAYTARAVLTFAFEADAAVVDTNIARVYARVAGHRLTTTQAQAMADASLPLGDSWRWNQCLMDLGATLCRPVPHCADCPLRSTCAWQLAGCDPVLDPAVGSAGVSRPQSRFEGSERQARGRLLKALTAGTVRVDDVSKVMQHPAAMRLVEALCAEGLVRLEGKTLRLP
ncbi:MAG: A/G-specific adenine glycosylase [Actinomycetia bacterium]|nr:A/G-specific adenine glycosylase [Actinomycetes bacterium]